MKQNDILRELQEIKKARRENEMSRWQSFKVWARCQGKLSWIAFSVALFSLIIKIIIAVTG